MCVCVSQSVRVPGVGGGCVGPWEWGTGVRDGGEAMVCERERACPRRLPPPCPPGGVGVQRQNKACAARHAGRGVSPKWHRGKHSAGRCASFGPAPLQACLQNLLYVHSNQALGKGTKLALLDDRAAGRGRQSGGRRSDGAARSVGRCGAQPGCATEAHHSGLQAAGRCAQACASQRQAARVLAGQKGRGGQGGSVPTAQQPCRASWQPKSGQRAAP